MMLVVVLTLLAHLVVPALFVRWVAFSRAKSRAYWLALVVTVAGYLLMMHVAGAAWHWLGFYWMYALWGMLVLAGARFAWRRWRVLPWWPERRLSPWVGFATLALVGLFFLSAVPSFVTARNFDGEAVALRFPLRDGVFHVGHGGSSEVVNHHYAIPAQRYALDVVELNGFGTRARGLFPSELDAYEIFGAGVVAPCEGEVVSARDGLPDLTPPEMDGENAAGNFVAIHCGDVTVMLGHLRSGTVRVEEGDRVREGEPIAEVGNSGNTSEPHLHVHAVRGRQPDHRVQGWEGRGVPMRFDDRFLIRNDRIAAD